MLSVLEGGLRVPVPAGAGVVSVRSARGNSGTLLKGIWSGRGLKPCHAIRRGARLGAT